jgi:hypothetical protein
MCGNRGTTAPSCRVLTCARRIALRKPVERLAFAWKDLGESETTSRRVQSLLSELETLGVDTGATSHARSPQ